ncbi:MAG: hypothetical protein ACRCTJ_00200, partial [Brevinema sp.]
MVPYEGSFFIEATGIIGTSSNMISSEAITVSGQPLFNQIEINFTNSSANLGFNINIYPSGTYVKLTRSADFIIQDSSRTDPNTTSKNVQERYSVPYFEITLAKPFLKNGFAYDMH